MRVHETTRLPTTIAQTQPANATERDVTDALLRLAEVERIAGIKRTTIARLEKAGAFPRRIALGPRCVRWQRRAVLEWVASPTFV